MKRIISIILILVTLFSISCFAENNIEYNWGYRIKAYQNYDNSVIIEITELDNINNEKIFTSTPEDLMGVIEIKDFNNEKTLFKRVYIATNNPQNYKYIHPETTTIIPLNNGKFSIEIKESDILNSYYNKANLYYCFGDIEEEFIAYSDWELHTYTDTITVNVGPNVYLMTELPYTPKQSYYNNAIELTNYEIEISNNKKSIYIYWTGKVTSGDNGYSYINVKVMDYEDYIIGTSSAIVGKFSAGDKFKKEQQWILLNDKLIDGENYYIYLTDSN